MGHDRKAFSPDAAADEPASLPIPAEDAAYWRGYHAAIAAQATPDDSASPRVRRVRVDGFSGARQVVFLEAIAEGMTVGEAVERAGAEDFIESCRPPYTDYEGPKEREPRPDARVYFDWRRRHPASIEREAKDD